MMDRKGQEGFLLISVILILLGVSALAVGMVYNAHHGRVAAQNYKNRTRAFYAADGMRALLAQEVMDGNSQVYFDSSLRGEIGGEVWNNVTTLDALRQAIKKKKANGKRTAYYLGSNWRLREKYGVRWRGYVIPPASGTYVFYVRADDEGAFYLSPDESPAHLPSAPLVRNGSAEFGWPMWGEGVSQPVALEIGRRYYFEFLHAQSTDLGFGQVGWMGPNYLVERPINGRRIASYGSRKEGWDTANVGNGIVKYALREAGPMVYTINTESMVGGKGDSVFRSPVNQTLSLRGDDLAPPESLWQKVIYYDFHADGSNPDFERGSDFMRGVVEKGLVRTKGLKYTRENADYFGLDSMGKPYRSGTAKWTCGVENWFTAWKPGWKKTYEYKRGSGDCEESDADNDTAFKNVVIKDSLLFVRRSDLGVNAYEFKRFLASGDYMAFSPLDRRGFGHEGKRDHRGTLRNYSFCMEIHTLFEHTSGMKFEFNGDDDVWLYINDSLVMDLGFVHSSSSASVNLDDLQLTFGQTYPLDFFYCERQTSSSSIDLITNLPVLMKLGKLSSSWKRDNGDVDDAPE